LFRRCIAEKAVARFKHRVRELTRRHRGVSLQRMVADLNPFMRGWADYFGFSQWHELPSLPSTPPPSGATVISNGSQESA